VLKRISPGERITPLPDSTGRSYPAAARIAEHAAIFAAIADRHTQHHSDRFVARFGRAMSCRNPGLRR
jgi:hypothetical protein